MKKTTTMMLCLAACFAAADTKITWLADVTADRAETVTGAQSNQIHDAAAHIVRTDNPHGVTAVQIGALTNEQDLTALRTYHYGSPDTVESPTNWFVFNGSGTITAFNWEAGRTNVVIPWAIGGVPVTVVGENAFQVAYQGHPVVSVIAPQTVTAVGNSAFYSCYSLVSVSLPQATAIGDYAFYGCGTLKSVSLPQATAIGGYAFRGCGSLPSVSLPQAQTVGDGAFSDCFLLASINLPQVTSIGNSAFTYCTALASINLLQATAIGDYAFSSCTSLTAVHMGQNAPAEATSVFAGITPPPTVYVTDPQATGWGAVWNGAPVVRPPLYGDAIYQAGELVATTQHVADAIAAIPEPDLSDRPTFAQTTNIAQSVGGGGSSSIKPVVTSSTNVVVTSTQSVYSVALTVASNVGVDFSNLALGGVSNAAVTLYLDCQTTQALYSVFDTNAIAMDCAWEPTVTGRYELVVSSDGVRTTAFQTSPSMCFFAPALIAFGVLQTSYGAMSTTLFPSGTLSRDFFIPNENNPRELAFLRLALSFGYPEVDGHLSFVCGSGIIGAFGEWSSVTNAVFAYPSGVNAYKRAYVPMRPAAAVSGFALPTRMVRVIKDVDDSRSTTITSATIRRMNALERAAYNAGAYPSAFRLDY